MYGHYRETSKPRISEYDGLIQQSMYFPSTIEPKNEEENITTTSLMAVKHIIRWGTYGKPTIPTKL